MRILVTGADGYLGRHVVRQLLAHTRHQVIGLDRSWGCLVADSHRFKRVTFDLRRLRKKHDPLKVLKVGLIVHLAASIQVNSQSEEGRELLETNSGMVLDLLQWAKANGVKKFLLASSMTVYAGAARRIGLNEDFPRVPSSFYGLSKIFAEEILRLYCRQNGMCSVTLRFPGLFGADRQGGLIYRLASRMKMNEDVFLNLKGLGNWEFLHVADAAALVVSVIEKYPFKKNYDVFNAGYADRLGLRELIGLVREQYCSRSQVKIDHKADYIPCDYDVGKLKRLLRPFPVSRRASLNLFLKEVR